MQISRRTLLVAVSSVVVLVILVAGFVALAGHWGGQSGPGHSGPGTGPATSPFTGEPVSSLGRELIVKIDNVPQARPPTGLTKADIIYLLPVEGGLSRIFAVFSSRIPPVVGPVRSSREEDIALLRQFGRPAFAFSGAQPRLLPVVERARIVDLYDGLVGGYFRSSSRVAPYNLYARTRPLLAEAKGASRARDIGFRFGPAPAGGTPAGAATTSRISQRPSVSAGRRRSSCATDARTTCTGPARTLTAAPRSRCRMAAGCRSPGARSGWSTDSDQARPARTSLNWQMSYNSALFLSGGIRAR